MGLMRRKAVEVLQAESTATGEGTLKRTLGPWSVTFLGVGAVIGAGIFSATGSAIAGGAGHLGAGPAIVISMVITAVVGLIKVRSILSMWKLSKPQFAIAGATLAWTLLLSPRIERRGSSEPRRP